MRFFLKMRMAAIVGVMLASKVLFASFLITESTVINNENVQIFKDGFTIDNGVDVIWDVAELDHRDSRPCEVRGPIKINEGAFLRVKGQIELLKGDVEVYGTLEVEGKLYTGRLLYGMHVVAKGQGMVNVNGGGFFVLKAGGYVYIPGICKSGVSILDGGTFIGEKSSTINHNGDFYVAAGGSYKSEAELSGGAKITMLRPGVSASMDRAATSLRLGAELSSLFEKHCPEEDN